MTLRNQTNVQQVKKEEQGQSIFFEKSKELQLLFEQAPVAICVLEGEEHKYVFANSAYQKMTNRREENFVGKTVREVFPELEGSEMFEIFDNAFRTGQRFSAPEYEVKVDKLNDGIMRTAFYNFTIEPIKSEEGNIVSLMSVAYDITEHVETRRKNEESNAQFSNLADNIPNLTWMANADGWIYWYNKKWYDYTGTSPEQMEGWGWTVVHDPEKLPEVIEKWKASITSGQPFEMVFPIKGGDGIFRQFLTRVLPINGPGGDIQQWFGTNTEITEQLKIQEQLMESETRYRALADNMPMISFIIEPNPEATISYWNKTWLDYTGQTFDEALGRAWDGIIHMDDVPAVLRIYVQAFEKREPYFIPAVRVKRYDGEYRWHLFKGNPRSTPNGEFLGYIGIGFDIHDQKLIQDALEERENKFSSLAQSLPQLVWVTDAAGNQEFASTRWKEYSGVEPGGEKEWEAIVHPEDYDGVNNAWVSSLQSGKVYRHEVRLKNKEGKYRWHRAAGEPVMDGDNKIIKWVGAFTDIHTEKMFSKQLEEQVQQRTRELELSNIELERVNKELQSFAYISSHDLQEPLRKIQTFATKILDTDFNDLSDHAKDNFNRMHSSAQKMQVLIQDLLAYSRTSNEERKFETTDLNKIIDEVKEDLSEELAAKHAMLDARELCEARIIPFQFRQLMQNLISNSLKFSKPQTPPLIKIRSEIVNSDQVENNNLLPKMTYCHISVADNGIGFEAQYKERIFEVFQRLHGKSEYNGSGIGLSIVKKIIENHHGIITAEGELNKGARFDIYIPAT